MELSADLAWAILGRIFSFVLCIASFLFLFVLEERPHVIQAIVSACRCGTKAWRWPELRWPTSMRSCECCADDGLSLLWLGINQLAKHGMGRSEENYLGQPSCQWGNFRSFPFSNFLAQVTCYGHWCVPCLQLCIKTAWSPGVSVAAQLLPRLLGTDAALYFPGAQQLGLNLAAEVRFLLYYCRLRSDVPDVHSSYGVLMLGCSHGFQGLSLYLLYAVDRRKNTQPTCCRHALVDPKRKGCSRKRCFFSLQPWNQIIWR